MPAWQERYRGSAEAERLDFARLADLMLDAQLKSRKAAKSRAIDRAFHVKAIAGAAGARLEFADGLPEDLRVGFAQPGRSYEAQVRFSNASSRIEPDDGKDLRGLAIRVKVSDDEHHDLLATNWPVSHARDARQFVIFAHALAGGRLSRLAGLVKLMFTLGPFETVRMLRNVSRGRRRSASLALETYWSRGAIAWGDEAVRYLFRPAPGAPAAAPGFTGPARLEQEFASRLANGDVCFELCVQRFVDERRTPIEDTAIEWTEAASPPIVVGTLTLPQRDLGEAEARIERRIVDDLGFNPWNTTAEFRPLGHLNRARKTAYDASLAHRQQRRWWAGRPPLRNRVFGGLARRTMRLVNRSRPWHRLRPQLFRLLNLNSLRQDLRQYNLIDTEPGEAPPRARNVPPEIRETDRTARTYEGRYNDLSVPLMGSVDSAFGRNMQPVPQSVDEPNAVVVCRELMDRHSFIPAKILNMLAAAWIQFQVHDWVFHARKKLGEDDLVVPIPPDYPPWASAPGETPSHQMRIAGNEPRRENPYLFSNAASQWWDGSEVYGDREEHARRLRDGALLKLVDGYLPEDVTGMEMTGFNESWWLGLSVLHTLFAREHNVLCGELERAYPRWDAERVYQTARLIVSALIAKIHTVEWTPAILLTDDLDVAMKTNWYGPHGRLTRFGIWLTDVHGLKGIPETIPDHHSAPYSLTEEFATVYRLHPLIPDDYVFYDYETGQKRFERDFLSIQGAESDDQMREIGLRDALYSFGIAHPGAITLNNFPRSLQRFQRNGEIIDLSVIDIVRTRKRAVPRYNQFRRNLRMPPVRGWEFTANPETNDKIRRIYGDPEKVDTVIGLLGETPPDGFGFSDTAFRIFILMASRRLQSDRFFTVDFRPEIYSPLGMDWIANNSMTSVILRHCPELAAVMPRDATAFAPWRPVY